MTLKVNVRKSNYLDSLDFPFFRVSKQNSLMRCDIIEEENESKILLDMPGYKKENVKIVIEDCYLTIYAERELNYNCNCVHNERYFGKTSRSFYVGDINKNDIKASLNEGVLEIKIPVSENKETSVEIE